MPSNCVEVYFELEDSLGNRIEKTLNFTFEERVPGFEDEQMEQMFQKAYRAFRCEIESADGVGAVWEE